MSTADLRSIARALGGEVQGRQVLAPGPNHARHDRSLSVRPSSTAPGGFRVHSFADDPFDLCRDYVAQRLGLASDHWRTNGQGGGRPASVFVARDPGPDRDRERRIARAVDIWQAGQDPAGTLVERYLASRGLGLPERASDVLRYNPRTPWGDKATGQTIFVPAMIAALRQVDGDAVTGIHRTRLNERGEKVDRMMLGLASGGAIKVDADDAVTMGLAIGEGIETVLQGRQLGFVPAWALGSAGAIGAFPVLAGIEALTIHAERDETNARAVETCARRWHAASREVTIIEPRTGSDLNDAARAA